MKKLLCLIVILALTIPALAIAEGSTLIEAEDPTLKFITREVEVADCSYTDPLPVFQIVEEKTGIHIDWETIPSDYSTVMSTRLAAMSDLPDFMNNPSLSINMLATGGIAARLNDLIDAYGPNIAKRLNDESQKGTKLELTAPDGGLYALPDRICAMENYCTNPMTFIIRFDWLEKCGIAEPPTTIQEWHDTLAAFRENDANGNGEADEVFCAAAVYMLCFGEAYGLDQFSNYIVKDDKVVFQWTTEEARDFLAEMNRWYAEGLIAPDYLTDRNIDARHLEDQDGASFMWSASNCDWQNKNNTISTPDWRPILPPKNVYTGEDGFVNVSASSLYGSYSIITDANGKADLAVKWFNYLWSDEGALLTSMGVEGETYYWDENGDAKFIESFIDGGNWYQNTKAYGIDPGRVPRVSTMYFSKAQAAGYGDVINEAAAKVVPYVQTSFPNYVPNDAEEMTISMYETDIKTYVQEMIHKFITGSEPMENFDAFVAQLNGMGLDDVLAIRQAQYDRNK